WPPVRRVEHRLLTANDTLRVWFRASGSPTPSLMHSTDAAVTADGRKCMSKPHVVYVESGSSGGMEAVVAMEYAGLPADGRSVEAVFFQPTDEPQAQPAKIRVRLPKASIVSQITQPSPLPAEQQGNWFTIRLEGFRWIYGRPSSAALSSNPIRNPEHIFACPTWRLKPRRGNLHEWEISLQFVPVGAHTNHQLTEHQLEPHERRWMTPVLGNWDARVYCFSVECRNRQTGAYELFEFYVPPPPVESLRRLGQLQKQSDDAILNEDYARGVRLWENAPSEFALQAHHYRGYACALQGDYPRAVEEFRKASAYLQSVHIPYDSVYEVRLALVCCLLMQGRRAEAVQIARDYIQQVYALDDDYLWLVDEDALAMAVLLPEVCPSPDQIAQRTRRWKDPLRQPILHQDALRRIRAVQAACRGDYRQAAQLLRTLTMGGLFHDNLWLAWFYHKSGDSQLAQLYLRQASDMLDNLSPAERGDPMYHNLELQARVLFPNQWRR
ncbi:MAG: hypothetical protein NZM28_10865, partial [Fimbriimonadales bacterium]|nr:hypothetical protein [Fimbriimonadales bacterium]